MSSRGNQVSGMAAGDMKVVDREMLTEACGAFHQPYYTWVSITFPESKAIK
jgi:hypothetical protein